MDLSDLCISCFGEQGGDSVCRNCGFDERAAKREAYHLPPRTILKERYIIGEVLGFGGFGVTYKAWDLELNIPVAVKEYFPTVLVNRIPGESEVIAYSGDKRSQYQAGLKRFLEEARNMAKFNGHPSIVNVYNFFEENNTAYIVMEFLDGLTLKQYLASCGGKMDYEDCRTVMDPVMRALEELHKKRIIHRDVAPDNIFITAQNKIKLIDFGAARFSSTEDDATRSIVIKPGYAPPEQYQGRGKQGPWTDAYAVGATMYHMLTGQVPEESIDRKVADELQRPSKLGIKMPLHGEKAVMKAMALKEGLRFTKIVDMRNAFAGNRAVDYPEVELKKRRRRRLISGITVGVLLVAIVSGLLRYIRTSVLNPAYLLPDGVTVWVPQSAAENMQAIQTGFFDSNADHSRFEIELVTIPDAAYAKRLEEAAGTDAFPDLFRSDFLPAQTGFEYAADLTLLYNSLELTDYAYLPQLYPSGTAPVELPAGFRIPVAYYNEYLLEVLDIQAPPTVNADSDFNFVFPAEQGEEQDMTQEVKQEENVAPVVCAAGIAAELEALWGFKPEYTTIDSIANEFGGDRAVVYLGYSNDLKEVQDALSGAYVVVPIEGASRQPDFTVRWAICDDKDTNAKKLAMLYLMYMLSVEPQQLEFLSNSRGLPVNLAVLDQYAGLVNPKDFDFLTNGNESVTGDAAEVL